MPTRAASNIAFTLRALRHGNDRLFFGGQIVSLAGALWLATRRSVIGLGRVIVVACVAFGVGLID